MGNGDNVRFWENVWVDNSSFECAFPHLYRVAKSHNFAISSLACSNVALISWNFNFFRNLNDWETCELISLLSRIDHVSLSLNLSGKRVWFLHSSREFTLQVLF